MGLTLEPKLTYSTHIHNISVQAHRPLQMIKTLTATGWGKPKEALMATNKAVMRPALEYASAIWLLLASSTSINKLQVMQNAALRTSIRYTQNTSIQHLHDETLILPIQEHLQLHNTIQHNIHHISYTNIQHTSTLQGLKQYIQQRTLHNKHSYRPIHSHYNRHNNYIFIFTHGNTL